MNNSSSDINQLLKGITLTNINDENKKAIKIKNVFNETICLSGNNTFGSDSIIATNNGGAKTPATTGFTPNNFYSDRFYFRATTNSVVINAYYIDFDYNEGSITVTCPVNDYVQIPFPVRFVNKITRISGNISGTTVCIYEPLALYPSGLDLLYIQLSAYRSYYSIYMVPKNKKAILNDIEYYINNTSASLSLIAFDKYNGSNDTFYKSYLKYDFISGRFTPDTVPKITFTEGQVIMWYQTNTTSTSNQITSSLEIINI